MSPLKKKRSVSVANDFPKGNEDPFGNSSGTVYKKMVDMMKYHPRITKKILPKWLHDYILVRIPHFGIGHSPMEELAVHHLYHALFDDEDDRKTMPDTLRKGETIALLTPDKTTAISALTYFEKERNVVVLWLATSSDYQEQGHASFLLKLLLQSIRSRPPIGMAIDVYLTANEERNDKAWSWYTTRTRRFATVETAPPFPKAMLDSFSEEPESSTIRNYLSGSPSTGLHWLHKRACAQDFTRKRTEGTLSRFFTNQDASEYQESHYAMLPGKEAFQISLRELYKCVPLISKEFAFLSDFFDEDGSCPKSDDKQYEHPPGYPPIAVSWLSRCQTLGGYNALDWTMIDFALAWLQRNRHFQIWKHELTIVPISVMMEASIMDILYEAFLRRAVKTDSDENVLNSIFHPTIDLMRFMNAARVVMDFILNNRNMFNKPYIATLTQAAWDLSWSCFIATNYHELEIRGVSEDGRVSGVGCMHCDPNHPFLMEGPPTQCVFFMKLAYAVLSQDKTQNTEKLDLKSHTSPDVNVDYWFTDMVQFGILFEETAQKLAPTFVPYAIADKFMKNDSFVGNVTKDQKNTSDVKSLCFLLDFVSYLKGAQDVLPHLGMGSWIPDSSEDVDIIMHEVKRCIIQVVDRVSEWQLGKKFRRSTEEYREYIEPMECQSKFGLRFGDLVPESIPSKKVSELCRGELPKKRSATSEVTEHKLAKDTKPKKKARINEDIDDVIIQDAENKVTKNHLVNREISPRKVGKNTKPKKIAAKEARAAAIFRSDGGSDVVGLSDTEESECSGAVSRNSTNRLQKKSPSLEVKKQKEVVKKKAGVKNVIASASSKKSLSIKKDSSRKRLAIELETDLQLGVALLTKKSSVRKTVTNDRMETIDEDTEEDESSCDTDGKKLVSFRKKSEGKGSPNVHPSSVRSAGLVSVEKDTKVVSDHHVATITSLFANRYVNAKDDTEKKDMQWMILRLLHEETPIPILGEALNQLKASLERVAAVDVGNQFRDEMCIWKNHRPNAFRERTKLFMNQYIAAGNSNETKRKVLITFELQLRKEGFRFFESNPILGNSKEMSMPNILRTIRLRMNHICYPKDVEVLKRGVLEDSVGDQNEMPTVGALTEDGMPTDMAIVCRHTNPSAKDNGKEDIVEEPIPAQTGPAPENGAEVHVAVEELIPAERGSLTENGEGANVAVLEPLQAPPGPFHVEDGSGDAEKSDGHVKEAVVSEPTPNAGLDPVVPCTPIDHSGQRKGGSTAFPKTKRRANAAYRAKITENVDLYRNATSDKSSIVRRVVEELKHEGYHFVSQMEGVWTVWDDIAIQKKVNQSFKDGARLAQKMSKRREKQTREKGQCIEVQEHNEAEKRKEKDDVVVMIPNEAHTSVGEKHENEAALIQEKKAKQQPRKKGRTKR